MKPQKRIKKAKTDLPSHSRKRGSPFEFDQARCFLLWFPRAFARPAARTNAVQLGNYSQPDYEAALKFTLSEATRLVGQLRREQWQARELSLTIRFSDFTETGGSHRFQHAQFLNSIITRRSMDCSAR